jgi:hypothetical protein
MNAQFLGIVIKGVFYRFNACMALAMCHASEHAQYEFMKTTFPLSSLKAYAVKYLEGISVKIKRWGGLAIISSCYDISEV